MALREINLFSVDPDFAVEIDHALAVGGRGVVGLRRHGRGRDQEQTEKEDEKRESG